MNAKNNIFKFTLLSIAVCVAGCDESNQEPAKVSATTAAPAPVVAPAPVATPAPAPIKTTAPIEQLPEWIKNAKKDDAAMCNIDLINNNNNLAAVVDKPLVVNNGTPLTIVGWGFDKKSPDSAKLKLAYEIATNDHKHIYVVMADRFERPDVANNIAFRELGVKFAGSSIAADTSGFASGVYELKIVMQRNDKEGITCIPSKNLWKIKF